MVKNCCVTGADPGVQQAADPAAGGGQLLAPPQPPPTLRGESARVRHPPLRHAGRHHDQGEVSHLS